MILGLLVRLIVYPILIGSICAYGLAKHIQLRESSAGECLANLDKSGFESLRLEDLGKLELDVQTVLHEHTRRGPTSAPRLEALNLISSASLQLTLQTISVDLREQGRNLARLRTHCIFLEGVLRGLESSSDYKSVCGSDYVGFDFSSHPRFIRAATNVLDLISFHEQQSSGLITRLDEAINESCLSIKQAEAALTRAFTAEITGTAANFRQSLISKALEARNRVNLHLKSIIYSQPERCTCQAIVPNQSSYQPLIDSLQKSPEDWALLTEQIDKITNPLKFIVRR
jgi:hypothetical protein